MPYAPCLLKGINAGAHAEAFMLECFPFLARIFHESPAATLDMAVLPGVLGCRLLRRTVQVRLGTNPALPRDGCQVHVHLHGLATSIYETSGLDPYLNTTY